MFSKQLIDYTMSTFKENKIDIAVKTMVKEVKEKVIIAQNEKKEIVEYPYGLLVWATGNTARPITKDLMNAIPEAQNSRRGLLVDEHLRLLGAEGIFALGDCTGSSLVLPHSSQAPLTHVRMQRPTTRLRPKPLRSRASTSLVSSSSSRRRRLFSSSSRRPSA